MPLQPCEVEGRYAGFLTKMALGQTSGGCIQLRVSCELRAEHIEEKDEYLVLQGPPQEISGRLILTKRDGTINGYQYGVLKAALDWDGKDIADLQNKDFSKVKVAIWIAEDEYQGNVRLIVDFIAALDWTPGITPATGKEMDKIKSAWATAKHDDETQEEPNALPDDDENPFA